MFFFPGNSVTEKIPDSLEADCLKFVPDLVELKVDAKAALVVTFGTLNGDLGDSTSVEVEGELALEVWSCPEVKVGVEAGVEVKTTVAFWEDSRPLRFEVGVLIQT